MEDRTHVFSVGSLLLQRLLQLLHLTLLLHQTLVHQPDDNQPASSSGSETEASPSRRQQGGAAAQTCSPSPAHSSSCWRPPAGTAAERSSRCQNPPGPVSASCSRAADGSGAPCRNRGRGSITVVKPGPAQPGAWLQALLLGSWMDVQVPHLRGGDLSSQRIRGAAARPGRQT